MALVPSSRRALTVSVACAVALVGAACSSVLGLDAPSLDPCANANLCSDSGVAAVDGARPSEDAGALVDAHDADAEAVVVSKTDSGIRCGSASADDYCAKGVCCLTSDDAGGADYTCAASTSDCAGYPIGCATNLDCSGTDVCCLYASAMKCEGETACANAALVCDPTGPADQCPTGSTCTVAISRDGETLPYFTCSP